MISFLNSDFIYFSNICSNCKWLINLSGYSNVQNISFTFSQVDVEYRYEKEFPEGGKKQPLVLIGMFTYIQLV